MFTHRRRSSGNVPATRTTGARRAAIALLIVAASLLSGCDDSIRSTFRQSAGTHIQATINTAIDNFFGGVDDVLNDEVQLPGSTSTTSTQKLSIRTG